jgi:hypothetical protein
VVVARQKTTQPGASYFQESVGVYVRIFKNWQKVVDQKFSAARYGPCKRDEDPNSSDVSTICVGNLIGLSISNNADGSTVKAFSAGRLTADGAPDWQELGQWTFSHALTLQGFSAFGDVLFAGPRTANTLTQDGLPGQTPHYVKLGDLPGRQVFNASASQAALAVDLSFVPRLGLDVFQPPLP